MINITTLPLAKKAYAAKTKVMGPNWKKGVTDKTDIYAKEMAKFLGIPAIRETRKVAWKDGTGRVTAEDFTSAVKGKEEKWARRLVEAFK